MSDGLIVRGDLCVLIVLRFSTCEWLLIRDPTMGLSSPCEAQQNTLLIQGFSSIQAPLYWILRAMSAHLVKFNREGCVHEAGSELGCGVGLGG